MLVCFQRLCERLYRFAMLSQRLVEHSDLRFGLGEMNILHVLAESGFFYRKLQSFTRFVVIIMNKFKQAKNGSVAFFRFGIFIQKKQERLIGVGERFGVILLLVGTFGRRIKF